MINKILIPNAPILVESTRSIGYSFESALADIIDNSIGKKATRIDVFFDSNETPYIAIIDNATGMSEDELENAMQYGSSSPLEERDKDDLGRFGLGLKMASLSQCRCLTVISKKNKSIHANRWDLDHIIAENEWSLIKFENSEIQELKFIEKLNDYETGTIVMLEKFDRLAEGTNNFQKTFDSKIEDAREHIALVFHRFMGNENFSQRVNIFFNNIKVELIDPFLLDNPATQPLLEQSIIINNSEIKVKPFVLPHCSKLKSKDKTYLGEVADLRYKQGFYIYRNKRLIIWGTWFKLIKNHELNKLARVRVDIPNSLDSIWKIDIKKSTASLPDMIKSNLVKIVKDAIEKSEKVYKYRGRKIKNDDLEHIWNVFDERGSYRYEINRNIALIKEIENSLDEKGLCYFNSLIKLIEISFPYSDVYYRMAKNGSDTNMTLLDNEDAYKLAVDYINSSLDYGIDLNLLITNLDKIEFFEKYPEVINQIKEAYLNE
ncbi:MAG: ATP-binding protein [Bacilli bacterium]